MQHLIFPEIQNSELLAGALLSSGRFCCDDGTSIVLMADDDDDLNRKCKMPCAVAGCSGRCSYVYGHSGAHTCDVNASH